MAQTDDSIDLKRRARRRLIGAIALVAFLIVIPPWLMEGEPRPPVSTLSVEIPSQNAASLAPRRPDAAAPKAPAAPSLPSDAKGAEAPAVEGAPTAPSPKAAGPAAAKREAPAPKKDAEPKAAPKKDAARKSAEAGAGYVVPLGTYASQENVKQLGAKLEAAGVKFYTESLNGGAQTRVRAGPFATREAAEKARSQLQALGLDTGSVASRN